jgi:hypothetical protein
MRTVSTAFSPRALSEYLAFRWLASRDTSWIGAYRPDRSSLVPDVQVPVATSEAIEDALRSRLSGVNPKTTGLLLSGGIDSAILARLVPSGLRAYTIRFDVPGAIDESAMAARFTRAAGLDHRIVTVTWGDYEAAVDLLMIAKRAPLHAVEVGLYKAALAAAADGIETLIVGNGADSTFGGLDRLLSRDWTLESFAARYTFVHPGAALRDPQDVADVFTPWARAERFDTAGFLKVIHGEGVTQAFLNAIGSGGCQMRAPYEDLVLDGELDLARIRGGESKYLLRDVFRRLYPGLELPTKIGFARPMDRWLAAWNGPTRAEFRKDLDVSRLSGEQRWLVWALDRFLALLERLHG